MQEHSFHQEGSDLGGSPEGRKDYASGQAEMGKPIFTEQMETDHREETIKSFAENILRLGNECRVLADENSRIKADMEALMTTPCSRLLRAEREENARLKAEVERLRASSFVTAVPVEQYERVIKAGDMMANWFCPAAGVKQVEAHIAYDAWNAAKEGKQP